MTASKIRPHIRFLVGNIFKHHLRSVTSSISISSQQRERGERKRKQTDQHRDETNKQTNKRLIRSSKQTSYSVKQTSYSVKQTSYSVKQTNVLFGQNKKQQTEMRLNFTKWLCCHILFTHAFFEVKVCR